MFPLVNDDNPRAGDCPRPATAPADLPERLVLDRASIALAAESFPVRITGHMLALIRSADDPIGRQLIPSPDELLDHRRDMDPLAELADSPTPVLIHRYPHRVAFLVSDHCAVHCRFCFRKRHVGVDPAQRHDMIMKSIDYIGAQPQVNEVLLTGGDPLMLSDSRLLEIMARLRAIRHVRVLRIHTRIPCVMPGRVTERLARELGALNPLYINIHFNHPLEVTPEAAAACALLAGHGIPLGSQTVLLRGINDDPEILRRLMEELLAIRVRPYDIHQLDRVPGTAHFQVALDKAVDLVGSLRGVLSGMAVPHLMIDLPGGGGKVALTPDRVIRKEAFKWVLRNWQGKEYSYEWEGPVARSSETVK